MLTWQCLDHSLRTTLVLDCSYLSSSGVWAETMRVCPVYVQEMQKYVNRERAVMTASHVFTW